MCSFLGAGLPVRSQLQAGGGCVFNDILQLDFSKTKQAFDELGDRQKGQMLSFYEENKANPDAKYVPKAEDRTVKLTNVLRVLARAAEYAKQARAWLQLENVIRYAWNLFSYDLTTPLELKDTDAWKYVVQLSEASLVLMEFLKNSGGRLRRATGREIDELKWQRPALGGGKTVAFQMHHDEEEKGTLNKNESKETLGTSRSSQAGAGGKGQKWFEKISDDFEVSLHASFIAFSVQCLMGVKQWESLVDLSNRLNDVTLNTYASQLLPFIIYAQTTLYQEAAQRTTAKRHEL